MNWNVSVGLKCVCLSRILSVRNLRPLKTSVSRKTIFSDDISCVNFIVVWKELGKSIKLLISALGEVHTDKSFPDERFI